MCSSDLIQSSGTLSAGQLTTLAWGTNGVIETVNVEPGSQVKKGDVLASLRLDSVPASILQARADLASSEETLDNLKDNALSLNQAQLDVVTAEQTLADAEKTFASLDYPRVKLMSVLMTWFEMLRCTKTSPGMTPMS